MAWGGVRPAAPRARPDRDPLPKSNSARQNLQCHPARPGSPNLARPSWLPEIGADWLRARSSRRIRMFPSNNRRFVETAVAGRSRGPGHRRAVSPEEQRVPQIRSFRALRFDPAVAGDLNRSSARPTTSSARSCSAACSRRSPRNAVRIDLPEDQAGRRARRSLPARRQAAHSVADRRHAPQGSPRRHLRLRADVRDPRHDGDTAPRSASSAGSSSRPSGPARASCRTNGPFRRPKEDRYKLMLATCGQHEPGRRAVHRSDAEPRAGR